MIKNIIIEMVQVVQSLQEDLKKDIHDVKEANHEKLLDRNDIKLTKMEQISHYKEQLNEKLVEIVQNGEDVNQYRQDVDYLETNLLQLSDLNVKLAAIVLPVKEMYKDIIDELTYSSGGTLIEVRA